MIRFLILALLLALPASADDLRHELERHGLTPEQLSEAGHHAFTSDFFINGAEHSGTSTTSLDANATDPPTFTTLTFLPADIRDQTPPATSFSWDAPSSSFILGGLEVAEQFAVRLAWDIDPAADETTCTARLLFTRSATTGNPGTTFSIDSTLAHMNEGAGVDYTQTAFIPVFVSGSLADTKDVAASLRIQASCDQEADVKIRDAVFYIWK